MAGLDWRKMSSNDGRTNNYQKENHSATALASLTTTTIISLTVEEADQKTLKSFLCWQVTCFVCSSQSEMSIFFPWLNIFSRNTKILSACNLIPAPSVVLETQQQTLDAECREEVTPDNRWTRCREGCCQLFLFFILSTPWRYGGGISLKRDGKGTNTSCFVLSVITLQARMSEEMGRFPAGRARCWTSRDKKKNTSSEPS